MKTEWLYKIISLAIIVVLFYLLYKVLSPFLIIIAWAMVLSITFYPLNRFLLRFIKRPWLASLITLIIILIIMLGPFSFIVGSLVSETTAVYSSIEERGFETLTQIQDHPRLKAIFEEISSYRIFEGFDFRQGAIDSLKSIGSLIAAHTTDFFTNAVMLIVNFFMICLTTYYFLVDGNELVNFIKKLLPFSEKQKDRLELRIRELVIAAIYGGLAVAAAQGVLGGLAFYFFGLPSPILWGTAMGIFSFIPVIGCAAIWLPAGIYLLLTAGYAKGIGFLVYSVVLIGSIDNVIRPLVIGGRTKLHSLLIFFSVLGGISYLGFLGFILGPLIAALCLSLLEIYTYEDGDESGS
ncbi:MAG: AI-2E family transporter [Nitrospirae bacterium]|nr:AI-2E family transporter [Nitrospirota bacterium]